jgi:serine/threonine protein kinase/Tfp pilus assembly protein PilF
MDVSLARGARLGRYEIVEPLGRGGMGEVYRALDSRLGRNVAVKVVAERFADDPKALGRFENEARAVAAISHPNILALFDVGNEKGVSYAVTELLDGETLRTRLERGPLARAQAVAISVCLAEGLAAAHSHGILHRDLKPENIFLTSDGNVKILDFGLARRPALEGPESTKATTETATGAVVGTPGYMSPEQVHGVTLDARTDLFSLGCVLYEMVSGRRAFAGRSLGDILAAILKDTPEPLDDPDLDRIAARCLEKDPAHRFQTAQDLAFALKSLGAEPARRKPAARRGPPSLAVLPFVNVGADPSLEYLSDGIAESLINSFSRLPKLRVVPRARAFRYRGPDVDPVAAGRELEVRAVLTGRVTVRGDDLNIQIDLIDVAQDSQLWGDQHSRKLADLLSMQDDIVRAVSDRLHLTPSREESKRMVRRYTDDTEAYQLYLKGRYFWDKRTVGMLKKSAELFRQALERDPTYALAYAGLAEAYAVYAIYNVTSPDQASPLAAAAVREALRLDDTIAEAHTALAFVKMTYEYDFEGSEREYQRAIELNPAHPTAHFWYGLYHTFLRRDDAAIAEFRRAQELAPLSLNVNSYVGWGLYSVRRTQEAVEQLKKTIEIDPNFPNAHLFLGMCYEEQRRFDEALEEMRKARELSGGNLLMIGSLGHAYGSAGLRDEAEAVLGEMRELQKQRYVAALDFANVYAGLKDREQALDWLERAYEERSAWLVWINSDPRLDWLRDEPRFQQVLRKVGMPAATGDILKR